MERRVFQILLVLGLVLAFIPSSPVRADSCTFVLGFQTIHDQIPDIVGECMVDQHYNPENGDALQETTHGLMVWRKADNFTAFTDGYRSWVNGPYGLQQRLNTERFDWEASSGVAAPSQPAVGASPLEILTHHSYMDAGWFHVVGEVRNNTANPTSYVKIIATLYDDAGNVTGTDFTYTELDIIPPGGKAPFETGTDKWAGTKRYSLQVEGRSGSMPRQDIAILSDKAYVDAGWLHIIGEVKNTGTRPAEYVKVVVTLYDKAGNVVGKDFTYSEVRILAPGTTSPFKTGTDHWPNYDHYSLQVQAR